MKFIQKLDEPVELINWKQEQQLSGVNYNYSSLQNPQKKIVRETLLKEQGYICCYCCSRISETKSHIEHFMPQSRTNDELSVDYRNLHVSCGSEGYWPKCCGNRRKNQEVPVSPLDKECESYFTYMSNGKITAVEDHHCQGDAKITIEVLGLNVYDLRKSREAAFETLIGLSDDDADLLFRSCLNRDSNEMFLPFCVAVVDYILQFYNIA